MYNASDILSELNGLTGAAKIKRAQELRDELFGEILACTKKRKELDKQMVSCEDLLRWWNAGIQVFEKNEHTRLHKLVEASKEGRIVVGINETLDSTDALQNHPIQTFVIRHDWARAFKDAVIDGETEYLKLPYQICSFEFRITGKTVVAIACQPNEETDCKIAIFVEGMSNYWAAVGDGKDNNGEIDDFAEGINLFVRDQINAICIALDSEAATTEVIRSPKNLNEKRIKNGKLPLFDYHIIDLSRKYRIGNRYGGHSGKKVRLHFRRGHWRHYETHNTWIRWCLVGDPDLGFIDKDYRL